MESNENYHKQKSTQFKSEYCITPAQQSKIKKVLASSDIIYRNKHSNGISFEKPTINSLPVCNPDQTVIEAEEETIEMNFDSLCQIVAPGIQIEALPFSLPDGKTSESFCYFNEVFGAKFKDYYVEQKEMVLEYRVPPHIKSDTIVIYDRPYKPTLVLKLDSSLIMSCSKPLKGTQLSPVIIQMEGSIMSEYVETNVDIRTIDQDYLLIYKRPFLFDFFKYMSQYYKILVYTEGSKSFASFILQILLKDLYPVLQLEILTKDKASLQNYEGKSYRALSVLEGKVDINNAVIVDDTPTEWPADFNHVLPISTFEVEDSDDALFVLANYLMFLYDKDGTHCLVNYKKDLKASLED